jgi:hypothetical protein
MRCARAGVGGARAGEGGACGPFTTLTCALRRRALQCGTWRHRGREWLHACQYSGYVHALGTRAWARRSAWRRARNVGLPRAAVVVDLVRVTLVWCGGPAGTRVATARSLGSTCDGAAKGGAAAVSCEQRAAAGQQKGPSSGGGAVRLLLLCQCTRRCGRPRARPRGGVGTVTPPRIRRAVAIRACPCPRFPRRGQSSAAAAVASAAGSGHSTAAGSCPRARCAPCARGQQRRWPPTMMAPGMLQSMREVAARGAGPRRLQ